MENTLAFKMVFREISKDVEYSFIKNSYNIFFVSSRTTFHHVEQNSRSLQIKTLITTNILRPSVSQLYFNIIPAYIVLKLSWQWAITLHFLTKPVQIQS